MKEPIYLIELFAGIGSQAKALKNIGMNVIHHKVIEFDKYAVASYNAVHNTNFKPTDITQIKGEDLEITNTQFYTYLLTYSFPCQDLSLAGKGAGMTKGNSTRSGLLWEVERLLNECKELPQYLLLENVPQIHSKKNIEDFKLWQKFLEQKGYINYWEDLNAKNYGIPQNRNRTFMVSIRKDIDTGFEFPKPFELQLRLKDMLEDEVDEKYFLNGERVNKLLTELVETNQIKVLPCCCDSTINEPKVRELSNCITARYNAGIQNQKQIGLCVVVKSINGLEIPLYKGTKLLRETIEQNTLYEGKPLNLELYNRSVREHSQTLTDQKHNTQRLWDGLRIRKLTPKECWRLMGFSDEDFEKAQKINSNAQLYKQAGNSIVVNVLECIFKELFKEKKEKKERKERYEKMSIFDFI